jgi:hypothetical protein
MALAFLSLERHLGLPRLQRAVRAAATAADVRDERSFIAAMERAAGQDLGWVLDEVHAGREFDYAIGAVTSESTTCALKRCVRTRVTIERHGAAVFGMHNAPLEAKGSSGWIDLTVSFADGSAIETNAPASPQTQDVWFESSAPASDVALDPDLIVALDQNRLNNFRTLQPSTNLNVARWSIQWAAWLQHALLTFAWFV